jgi:NADH dehydrogenase FAD-containing subunit
MKKKENVYVVRNHEDIMFRGITFKNEAVTSIQMGANSIETQNGKYKYDYLVICPGISLRWDLI